MTAKEIREKIVDTVSKRGGHLASSLGAVEIAMALAEEFDAAHDRIVWDVGHQAYAWKILTGRAERFGTLRQLDGISGFPNPAESPCDAAVAGHAGVALSVAEGYAAARKLTGEDYHVVAVTGDSSLVNGTSFEALNNCAGAGKVILVLNDNGMSISKSSGSFSRFLGRLIAGARYNRVKNAARRMGRAMRLYFLYGIVHRFKARVKSWFLADAFFEQFGFRYLGPVDGHDLAAIRTALAVAKEESRSVIVHVVTKKGKGFKPAEHDPTRWHGVGPFADAAGEPGAKESKPDAARKTWSEAFGDALCELARADKRIVALTAGMKDGTGLGRFAEEFPDRFFDAGIAEGHMVAFAAGLAAAGLRPVVAVYSTFLQRAVDQVMHDVCISSLPVVICIDRAGAVGEDGATHQGLYDIPMLRCLPNLAIATPKDAADMKALLAEAFARNAPTAIRYPRGRIEPLAGDAPAQGAGKAKWAIWSTGDWLWKAQAVAAKTGAQVVHARYLKPFDNGLLKRQRAGGMKIASLENGAVAGGFGEAIGADLKFGWPDSFLRHGKVSELERLAGLDVDSIAERILSHG
ncbi:MAG: 1-deoxy-D-xylulose-5-phosphate synthase [Kiritimatiellae bacterium]|nr:1-deoxy-D-xylulose-5-phosphate synthase [Kiritimatiellia bacterium]